MKFGKNLIQVVAICNPEWGQYWINYKFLKKKIKTIVANQEHKPNGASQPESLSRSANEVEFFKLLRRELKKTSDFFGKSQDEFRIRWERIWDSYQMLQEKSVVHDKYTWTRLLSACVRFYKDVLLLENFAIMNYCGFSKILKKHDKNTGYSTRKAFMDKVMHTQNFTHYPYILELIRHSEKLFQDIQTMESVMPLQDEERLFIDALRGLNFQASRMQAEEKEDDAEPTRPVAAHPEGTEELSEQLDAATSILVDAARKLSSGTINSSPDLHVALSWMQSTVKATAETTADTAAAVARHKRSAEDGVGSVTDDEHEDEEMDGAKRVKLLR